MRSLICPRSLVVALGHQVLVFAEPIARFFAHVALPGHGCPLCSAAAELIAAGLAVDSMMLRYIRLGRNCQAMITRFSPRLCFRPKGARRLGNKMCSSVAGRSVIVVPHEVGFIGGE